MRTYAGEIGDGTLGYVETDDPGYREEAEEGRTSFEEARGRTISWSPMRTKGGEPRSTLSTKSTRP